MNTEIINHNTFKTTIEHLPAGTLGLLSSRAALRALPVIKKLLDENDEVKVYALDSFRDLSTALFFALYNKPPKDKFTFHCKRQAYGALRNLCSNDEYFAYGYISASYAVEDIMQFNYNEKNGVVWALKSTEIGATERLGFLEARLWQEVNIDSININRKFSAKKLFETPLFKYGSIPGNPHWQPKDLLLALKHAGPEWQFWRDWYQGFLDGKPLDWELQREVALIPDEDWDKGPEHIAGKIEEIRKKYDPIPIDPKLLRKQALNLIAHPDATQMTADGLALQIEDAITQFMKDANCNSLPEEFEILERLPPLLRVISKTVIKAKSDAKYLEELENKIQALTSEIISLQTQLEQAKANSVQGILKKNILEQAGKSIGDWKMWGAIMAASWALAGQPALGDVLDKLPKTISETFPKNNAPVIESKPIPNNPIET